MSTGEDSLHEAVEKPVSVDTGQTALDDMGGHKVRIEPDLEFVNALRRQGGGAVKKCIQCGTCSGTCTLTPDRKAFPCKEMAWAFWGMKERLLKDPDIWLCYQCNDCSTRCPRGVRPGDVMGALRQMCIQHYASPRFLARWASQPQAAVLLLGIPAALLTAALYVKDPLERFFGISGDIGDKISYAYSAMFPHWLLNSFFGLFTVLMLVSIGVSVRRFWHALGHETPPVRGIWSSLFTTLRGIFTHDRFASCDKGRPRFWSHTLVFYGFMALTLVALWVITSGFNPLIGGNFIYPFNFFSPWKILANIGGAAVLGGCILMIRDRLREDEAVDRSSYHDWVLVGTILIVVLTGFITEALHYVRLEPHRHLAYFVHLVFVFALLMYLPFSKFAHIVYRTTMLVHAEYTGRAIDIQPAAQAASNVKKKEAESHVATTR